MKIIFLDVDGVLNRDSTEIAAPSGCMFVEDELVKRLQRIYYETHAKIVLSSTWRRGWYDIASGKTEPNDVDDYNALATKLLSFGIPINGYTPIMYGHTRGEEIAQYLRITENVETFIILDDIAVDEYESRQIKTNPKTGLTDEDAEKAIELLK